jgi:hypothetical protein
MKQRIIIGVFLCVAGGVVLFAVAQRVRVWWAASDQELAARTTYYTKYWEHKADTLERNDTAVFYTTLGAIGSLVFAVVTGALVLTTGKHREMVRRASVFFAKIGRSEVPVHYNDLSKLGPVYAGLTAAEQLYQSNEAKKEGLHYFREFAEISRLMAQGRAALTPQQVEAAALPAGFAPTPTFADLLRTDQIAPGKPLICGFHQATGTPQYRTFADLKSLAVSGWQGSGKTLSMVYLVSSLLLIDDRTTVYVVDPHGQHHEGLASLLKPLTTCGRLQIINPFDLPQLVRTLNAQLDRRLQNLESSQNPVVLVVDELARLSKLEVFEDLLAFITRCTEETRKANILAILSSQKWSARNFGGRADIRQSIPSTLIHKTRPSQAELLLEDSQEKKLVKQLSRPGEALLSTSHDTDPSLVKMPLITRQDVAEVARILGGETVLSPPKQPSQSGAIAEFAEGRLNAALVNAEPALNASASRRETPRETTATPTFGALVRARCAKIRLPDRKPLSQNKLGELAGISKKDMSLYLNGGKPVSAAMQAQILRVLVELEQQGNTPETAAEAADDAALLLPEVNMKP